MRNREQFSPDENETDSIQDEESQEEVAIEDETEENYFDVFAEKLGDEEEILTDEALLGLLKESFIETGAEEEKEKIEEADKERPLIFYRAMRDTEDINKLLAEDEIFMRPFSYAKPGKWSSEREGDIPLSYGGKNPRLLRIID